MKVMELSRISQKMSMRFIFGVPSVVVETTDDSTRGDVKMSDRVALNGRSTGDERTCDRNTREPFLNRAQARLAPKPPVFELRRMRECSRKRASLTITHNDQTTYQTIHFKHNNTNRWAKTVPGIKFKWGLTNCQDHRQDCSFLSNSTWLVHKPAYQAVLYLRKARNRVV